MCKGGRMHNEPQHQDIATLAYAIWVQRGSPVGNPDEDWFRAEQEFKKRTVLPNALRELIDAPPRKH
jgi:Protein of unknown function (DUF2934)